MMFHFRRRRRPLVFTPRYYEVAVTCYREELERFAPSLGASTVSDLVESDLGLAVRRLDALVAWLSLYALGAATRRIFGNLYTPDPVVY